MKRCLTRCLIAVLLLGSGPPAWADGKIGVVLFERIFRESQLAKRAEKKVGDEFSARDQELAKLAEQMKRLQDDLQKQAITLSESDLQKRQQQLNAMNSEFQRKQRGFGEDLRQRQDEELREITNRVNRAVEQVASAENYDIIVDKAVWITRGVDITDKVIQMIDDPRPPQPQPKSKSK